MLRQGLFCHPVAPQPRCICPALVLAGRLAATIFHAAPGTAWPLQYVVSHDCCPYCRPAGPVHDCAEQLGAVGALPVHQLWVRAAQPAGKSPRLCSRGRVAVSAGCSTFPCMPCLANTHLLSGVEFCIAAGCAWLTSLQPCLAWKLGWYHCIRAAEHWFTHAAAGAGLQCVLPGLEHLHELHDPQEGGNSLSGQGHCQCGVGQLRMAEQCYSSRVPVPAAVKVSWRCWLADRRAGGRADLSVEPARACCCVVGEKTREEEHNQRCFGPSFFWPS